MSSPHTTTLQGIHEPRHVFLSADCQEDFEAPVLPWMGLLSLLPAEIVASPVTSSFDLWLEDLRKEVSTTIKARKRLLISDLGWSSEEALETHLRLKTFQEDWNAPGMELYDEL